MAQSMLSSLRTRMRFGLLPLLAVALATSRMHADTDIAAVQQLPVAWQDALSEHHAKPNFGRAAGDDAWSIEEHAELLGSRLWC